MLKVLQINMIQWFIYNFPEMYVWDPIYIGSIHTYFLYFRVRLHTSSENEK